MVFPRERWQYRQVDRAEVNAEDKCGNLPHSKDYLHS